jgi:hypothetical protein
VTIRRFSVRPAHGVRFQVDTRDGTLYLLFDDLHTEAAYQLLELTRDKFLSEHGGPVEVPSSPEGVVGTRPTRIQPPKVGGGTTAMPGMLGTARNAPMVPAGVRPPPPPKMQIPGGTQGGGLVAPIPGAPPAMPQPAILQPPAPPTMKPSNATPLGSVLPVQGQTLGRPRPASRVQPVSESQAQVQSDLGQSPDPENGRQPPPGNGMVIRPKLDANGQPVMTMNRQGQMVQETEAVVTGEPVVLPQPDILPPPPPSKGPRILAANGQPTRQEPALPVNAAEPATVEQEKTLEGDTLPSPAPPAE